MDGSGADPAMVGVYVEVAPATKCHESNPIARAIASNSVN